jgi:AcrR family transcriptional regulator
MAASRRARKSYHHGDLAAALVQAGLTLVEEEGIEAVSLRAVARRAAVSHSAPYHHFATKAELLAAIAAAGFDRMVGTLLSTIVACQQAKQLPATDPRLMAAVCWSTVHGLAVLHVEQVLSETPLGELPVEQLVRYVVEAATVAPIHTPADPHGESSTKP